jgi:hypothetical protein
MSDWILNLPAIDSDNRAANRIIPGGPHRATESSSSQRR